MTVQEISSESKSGFQSKHRCKVLSAITAQLIHSIEEDGGFTMNIGAEWNLSNDTALDFVDQIEKKFRQQNKFHGFFNIDKKYTIVASLKSYLDKTTDFSKFVNDVMSSMKVRANKVSKKIAGGNIVFVHYKSNYDDEDLGRILIVMVDQKSGFDFDDDLQPKKLSPIDTDALRQAALFDLTLFDTVYPKKEGEPYLKYLQGKSKSNFFKETLALDNYIANQTSVKNLFDALNNFIPDKALLASVTNSIETLLLEKAKNRKSINIREIEGLVDKLLPEKSKLKGKFCVFINENEYAVNDNFEPTVPSVKKGVQIEIKDSSQNFSCVVNSKSISYEGAKKAKQVLVDRNLSYIKIPITDGIMRKKITDILGDPDES